ncbi:hypothetical protein [Dyadobacter sp. 3J3]|uniref:hypothetical protein n=1 Tax=Dyadobacter sp. 3J3 TaxID=2606600 RepID=UPI0013568B0B|nr:hypothetical protein [Dyadobacter sp. 3J3]
MDYKELLKKYIKHVVDCESTDFVQDMETIPWKKDDKYPNQYPNLEQLIWTKEEIEAIVELSGFDEREA